MRRLILLTCAIALTVSPARGQTPMDYGTLFGGGPVPGLRGFNVVLVQGSVSEAPVSPAEAVPAAAAKALADLKEILPYKSYRLLDTQWTIGSGHLTTRLRGPNNAMYDLDMVSHKGASPETPVAISRFFLSQAADTGPQQGDPRAQQLYEKGVMSLRDYQQQNARSQGGLTAFGVRPTIDTSFGMRLGETVVVGTSRVQADTALVVLLTAVPDAPARGK